jgi:uncharacterized lipoprotein YddW (UPF0748 family)
MITSTELERGQLVQPWIDTFFFACPTDRLSKRKNEQTGALRGSQLMLNAPEEMRGRS